MGSNTFCDIVLWSNNFIYTTYLKLNILKFTRKNWNSECRPCGTLSTLVSLQGTKTRPEIFSSYGWLLNKFEWNVRGAADDSFFQLALLHSFFNCGQNRTLAGDYQWAMVRDQAMPSLMFLYAKMITPNPREGLTKTNISVWIFLFVSANWENHPRNTIPLSAINLGWN